MFRLASMLFSMIATTCAGIGVIAALTMGYDTLVPILIAAGAGLVVALPATWIVTRKIAGLK